MLNFKPYFWNLKKTNLLSYLFQPLTMPIRLSNLILNTKKKFKTKKIKTICVGNIYVGGTGKTPTVIKLYEIFKNNGLKVFTAKKFYADQKDEDSILKNRSKFISYAIKQSYVLRKSHVKEAIQID